MYYFFVEENIISRRVLRARGVSSYMEQFSTSDDEIEEDELEGWPDFEAKYASACASPNIPAVHNASTSGQAETWQSEDSDQDWILPGARKRKNRRSGKFFSLFMIQDLIIFSFYGQKELSVFFFISTKITQQLFRVFSYNKHLKIR